MMSDVNAIIIMYMYLSVTIFRDCLPGAPKVLTPLVKIIQKVEKEIDFYYLFIQFVQQISVRNNCVMKN